MNTRYLASFCTVAERGSLSAAARQLGLANATLAEQIRSLETELGTKLIMRRGQGVALTAAGLAVLEQARSIVEQVESLRHRAQLGRPVGRLRVGAISTALVALLPGALQRLAARYPDIELTVAPGTSAGLFMMLERGDIDCALMVEPPFAIPKGFKWRRVRDEPLVLVSPPALSGSGIRELCAVSPFIRMDRKAWTGQIVDRYLADHGLRPRELFEMDAPEAILALVAKGMGIALLPDWGFSSSDLRQVRIWSIDDSRYGRPVGVLCRTGSATPLVDAFQEVVSPGSDSNRV